MKLREKDPVTSFVDTRGRIWKLVGQVANGKTEPLDDMGLPTFHFFSPERHYSAEDGLLDTFRTTGVFERIMNDIRQRTARKLLMRSSNKAIIVRVENKYRLAFISDHADDDHELAQTLAPEIDRLVESDDDIRNSYQVV